MSRKYRHVEYDKYVDEEGRELDKGEFYEEIRKETAEFRKVCKFYGYGVLDWSYRDAEGVKLGLYVDGKRKSVSVVRGLDIVGKPGELSKPTFLAKVANVPFDEAGVAALSAELGMVRKFFDYLNNYDYSQFPKLEGVCFWR